MISRGKNQDQFVSFCSVQKRINLSCSISFFESFYQTALISQIAIFNINNINFDFFKSFNNYIDILIIFFVSQSIFLRNFVINNIIANFKLVINRINIVFCKLVINCVIFNIFEIYLICIIFNIFSKIFFVLF
jgi:hypothetical protein